MYVIIYKEFHDIVRSEIKYDFYDTLMFARRCHDSGYHIVAITNIPE